jgi:phosphinothricin acetyltransferase
VIRLAGEADNAQIAAIWNLEAIGTTATTDTEPRDARAQAAWLGAHNAAYPALVAVVDDEEVVAFGGLAPYRPKPSYARTVEDSVYVKDGWRGKGLGGLILDALIERARCCGHHAMIARIIAENDASRRLHARRGFVQVGHEREVAFKLGRWLDVLTLQRML